MHRWGLGTTTLNSRLRGGHIDGIGTYTKNLLAEYKKLNQITVPVTYPRFISVNGCSSSHILQFPLSYLGSSIIALVPLGELINSRIEKQIDCFHAPDYHIPKFPHIPVVATLHDAIPLKHPEWTNQSLRQSKNFFMKSNARWAQRIITGANAMIPDLVEFWGIRPEKIDVIYHGVDTKWLEKIGEKKKQQILNKYKLNPNYLLAVGTLQKRKNIERIIEAFKRLPLELQKLHKLVLVGKNGWQTDELLEKIHQLEAKELAIWLRYVPTEDLYALYQSAKLFLFPSLYEGFGLPILEAFASQIPVITSNITAMPEVAGDAAYLIDPYNIDSLYEGIYTLLTNDLLAQTQIQKGIERVKQFSWQKCAEETLLVYQSAIS